MDFIIHCLQFLLICFKIKKQNSNITAFPGKINERLSENGSPETTELIFSLVFVVKWSSILYNYTNYVLSSVG